MSEKITKSINIGILAVIFVFLALIVIPRINAQETDYSNTKTINALVKYKLDIPCAIDRTQIIVPNPGNSKDPNEQYKARCNSNAFFDEVTGVYHFKRNEGYYFNLMFTNNLSEKPIDPTVIDSIVLEFYKNNEDVACFYRKMDSVYNEQNKYVSKISYTQPNESEEFAINNMSGFIRACGVDTEIDLKTKIYLVSGEVIDIENDGLIKKIIIDSDNSNQIAQANRNKEQVRDLEQKRESPTNQKPIPSSEKPMIRQAISENKPESQLITRTAQIQKENNSEIFLNIENSVKKMIPIEKIFQENRIDSKKVIGDIVLDTNSSNPEYVFEIREKRKLFGFIPIGEKIVEKRISATLEIKE